MLLSVIFFIGFLGDQLLSQNILIACSDYFDYFLVLKRAFSTKKVMSKNSRTLRYA